MRINNSWLLMLLGMVFSFSLQAHIGPTREGRPVNTPSDQVNFRENCSNAVTQIDQQINNVRARLTTGGDVWWNGDDGRYIVPKPPPGVPEVSSIFAGAVWIGGRDPGNNLKVAAQTFGRSQGNFDFYPGPLFEGDPDYDPNPLQDPRRGTIGQDTCAQWDKFFVVKGANIDAHVANWRSALEQGQTVLDIGDIPDDILGWPAKGNSFFEQINQFQLPNTEQGLAGFWDQDQDGFYNPDLGDYPIIEIRGCLDEEPKSAPDEMIFWIYNDAGNAHRQSGSDKILQMEVQVQAFAYVSNDDINSMTFQRYKLINRSIERLDSTYFAMWVDPDLGCYTDDYVGCDVDRSLAYVYNADQLDGTNGCTCDQGVNTYCDEIPILGVDYFRGPLAPIYDSLNPDVQIGIEELGMSSFIYYNNGGFGTPAAGTIDPSTAQEYYNYLSGKWRDGTPFTVGGDGYQTGGEETTYAFVAPPNENGGWSMCEEGISQGDRRTLQASGPFTLLPGAVNELIVGVVWVPDQVYPCPSITRLQKADDIAQSLFDNCFKITLGPDAPDVDWVELDREIVAVFSNDDASNNAGEEYNEVGLGIPSGQDTIYRFEGYKLYQLSGPSVSLIDRDDATKVRLVYQVDKTNGVSKIFNWEGLNQDDDQTPTTEIYYVPELQVNGADQGIRHTFSVTEDQFAEGDRRLINHRKYYFAAVAYGYNNYKEFDPSAEGDQGQQSPYLEGKRNIGDGDNAFYTVIPRKILDRQLQSAYADGPVITRIDGIGTGSNFLDLSNETRTEIEKTIANNNPETFSNEVTYKGGMGPIDVKIFNPLDVLDGEYELTFTDDDLGNDVLDAPAYWTLRNLTNSSAPVITSDKSIEDLNEQVIREYGFSITIAQVPEPGATPFDLESNGAIGYTEEYLNPEASPWLFGIPDNTPVQTGNPLLDGAIFDYMATTNSTDADYPLDPDQSLSLISQGGGSGTFVPYYLCDWRTRADGAPYLSPAWQSGTQNAIVRSSSSLADLNNVDIVFTSNKDLWSRCVIVEMATPSQVDIINVTPENEYVEGGAKMFDLRARPSVSKEAGPDGLPLPDTTTPEGEEEGMGWFPGYAVDVETGQRLNIFFGENSIYNDSMAGVSPVGSDMMFNPSSEFFFQSLTGGGETILNFPLGGQHYVYVTKQPYDRCAQQLDRFTGSGIRKILTLKEVTWTGLVIPPQGGQMNSYEDGLIPEDVIVKLRVTNPYQVKKGTNEFNGYPTYRFTLDGKEALPLDAIAMDVSLQSINVIPNPYYGFSEYEDSQFENIVKISNLPALCVVSIYSLDGKFIRTYNRNEVGRQLHGTNRSVDLGQINPDLEWDLKNFKGIPIASGVYLIHVSAPGLGERTLKWFGVNRQFDPSGL